ncbi:MAG: nucleotidyl transferase AbiEii/AbiGii toxin family protein [Caulobacterales bacterium]|nr:nucleotidyl transferase AbiEii/AbiGii toxin family protein [Caulobacterales bacterium]
MDKFAKLSIEERDIYINEAANRSGLTPIIIEKDFWVCWTLDRLSKIDALSPYLTFKGGTSLSKCYGAIQRFSEDIDLTISRNAPIINEVQSPFENGISNNETKRRIETLSNAAKSYVQTIVLPTLSNAIANEFGESQTWQIVLDDDDKDGQTILFKYPSSSGATQYIKPQIKLELGARGDIEPNEVREIKPYISYIIQELEMVANIKFPTLSAQRTFWEKATILHALHHSPNELRDRMSRHYYDVYMLSKYGIADTAISQPELLEAVVKNKSLMFKDNKASYETAILGSLKLVPKDTDLDKLKSDYAAMNEMFMEAAPSIEDILAELLVLENKINGK